MFRSKLSFLLQSLLIVSTPTAQTGVIKGSISDISGLPLQGANILLKNTTHGTTSDENGDFEFIDIAEGYYTLNVNYIGYEPVTYPDIWVRPNAYDALEVLLTQLVIEFDVLS